MVTVLQSGGVVELWGGWEVCLPPAVHDRNADGSWSAWGADWALDVHIIEHSPKSVSAASETGDPIKGAGWTGELLVRDEEDGGRPVKRYCSTLRAPGSIVSAWVSVCDPSSERFALSVINGFAWSGVQV